MPPELAVVTVILVFPFNDGNQLLPCGILSWPSCYRFMASGDWLIAIVYEMISKSSKFGLYIRGIYLIWVWNPSLEQWCSTPGIIILLPLQKQSGSLCKLIEHFLHFTLKILLCQLSRWHAFSCSSFFVKKLTWAHSCQVILVSHHLSVMFYHS